MEKIRINSSLRWLIIPLLIILAGILISAAVYAYFVDKKDVDNNITIGKCDVVIEEDFDPPNKYEPGDIINKKPWVSNIGTVPCYVRIRADISNGQLAEYLDIDFNSDEWSAKQEDGYYYYLGNGSNKGILGAGETTEALFTTVKIQDNIPSDLILNFDIYVYAEAVQAQGFDSADEAWMRYTPETNL
jgi:predicted ribosomally synthesized peptide with SipW-like signal peptide